MANILYLTHRLPFPPDKGDKITTFNFLRHLASRHRVYLGTFVDEKADWQHVDELKKYCAEVKLIGMSPSLRRAWSAQALFRGESLSGVYYRSRELQAWVDATVPRHRIGSALAYCSAMAPYLAPDRFAALTRVAHFADVDSEKWTSYAASRRGLMRWVFAREGKTLLALERAASRRYNVTSLISEADADLYRRLAPEVADRVRVIPNGVNTDYFDPDLAFDSPFDKGARPIVFTGAMDYWPNADAVRWFATEVLGPIRQGMSHAEFWIVGSNPSREVLELAAIPGVNVTGRVADVRPYLAHAGAIVAPLRVARGTQNKVLEAYAMARNVVLTSAAANGVIAAPHVVANTCDSPAEMARATLRTLAEPQRFDGARDYAMANYSWAAAFVLLDKAMGFDPGGV